eukprot:6191981-Pleurochrysis_carterae.AAC.3
MASSFVMLGSPSSEEAAPSSGSSRLGQLGRSGPGRWLRRPEARLALRGDLWTRASSVRAGGRQDTR